MKNTTEATKKIMDPKTFEQAIVSLSGRGEGFTVKYPIDPGKEVISNLEKEGFTVKITPLEEVSKAVEDLRKLTKAIKLSKAIDTALPSIGSSSSSRSRSSSRSSSIDSNTSQKSTPQRSMSR